MNIIRCGIVWRLLFENSMMLYHSKCNFNLLLNGKWYKNGKRNVHTPVQFMNGQLKIYNDVMATTIIPITLYNNEMYKFLFFFIYFNRMCIQIYHRNPVPYENSMDAKYEELINSHARWFTDGHIDKQKNIQLSLSSQLPLTNEMTFILVFSMWVCAYFLLYFLYLQYFFKTHTQTQNELEFFDIFCGYSLNCKQVVHPWSSSIVRIAVYSIAMHLDRIQWWTKADAQNQWSRWKSNV